jgi:predicted nucleotide-binding protein
MLIHGHASDRYELEAWLQRHQELCETRVMQEEFSASQLLPQKLEELSAWADGAIALATPDDVGGPVGKETSPRARQNVWVEVGWFWGRLGRESLLLLRKGEVEIPSDLQGLLYYSYSEFPSERAEQIRDFSERLRRYRGAA